ncbi:hypothetical protein FACS1894147_11340 [Spirochaetia bacterium]|nr:hypothetical protein FACS1894147_11340 [Spirochaetia bacterium]
MKFLAAVLVFACVVFPVFSQDSNAPKYRSLDETMGNTISATNSQLSEFDKLMTYNGNAKVYASYKQQYDSLSKSIQSQEIKLKRMIQSYDNTGNLKKERDMYETLIRKLEAIKSEYENWLKNIQ